MLSFVHGSFSLLTFGERLWIGAIIVARLLTNLLDVLGVVIIGYIAGLALSGPVEGSLFDWLPRFDSRDIPLLLALAASLFLSKTALTVVFARWLHRYIALLEAKYSSLITQSVLLHNPQQFQKMSRPQLEWAILRSTNFAFSGVIGQTITLVAEIALAISILTTFFLADAISALAVTSYLVIVVFVFQVAVKKRTNQSGNEFSRGSVSVGERLADAVNAYKELTVLGSMGTFVDRIVEARKLAALAQARQLVTQSLPRLILELALVLGALALGAFIFSEDAGDADYSFLGLLIFGTLRIMSSLLPLQAAFISLRFMRPNAESAQQTIKEFLATIPHRNGDDVGFSNPSTVGKILQKEAGASLTLNRVCFERKDGGRAFQLDSIDFQVPSGKHVAIIGPSGSGKTTLVDLILGLLRFDSGEVLIDGLSPLQFRSAFPGKLAYVPQKPGMVSGTIADNIALGIAAIHRNEEQLVSVVESAGLREMIRDLPDGLDSNLGAHLGSFSGGQIQRIGLARALYREPRLLVLDEATSALDAKTESNVSNSLSKLHGQTTVITIAHRLSTVKKVDQIHVLEDGGILASGTFAELKETNSTVQEYISLLDLS